MKLLIVIDMQNDFVTGCLGTSEARAIVPNVKKKIEEWDGELLFTRDTHNEDYLNTPEGKKLPIPHCIENTDGCYRTTAKNDKLQSWSNFEYTCNEETGFDSYIADEK